MVIYVILKNFSAIDQDGSESYYDQYLGLVNDLKTAYSVLEILVDQKLDDAEQYNYKASINVEKIALHLLNDIDGYHIEERYHDRYILVTYRIKAVRIIT